MSKQHWKQVVKAAARISLACALVSVPGASAQDSTAQGRPKPVAAQPSDKQAAPAANAKARIQEPQTETAQGIGAEMQSRAGSTQEGIKVHGHWTIEVRNPDGSVVTHREFENSLSAAGGGSILTNLLAHQSSAGALGIGVGFATGSGGSCVAPPFSGPGLCFMFEPGPTLSALQFTFAAPPGYFTACNQNFGCVQTASVASSGGSITISGTLVAATAGSVNLVTTMEIYCPNSTSPSSCLTSGITGNELTRAIIAPVAVAAGQTIAATVTISFS
jgi:hypothetical protein